ncbi:MAG: dephospho-CoA kinase [Oscillospiraceae bacterium]|nr:dephospho-CoA kinase [Oscillospiraceae bacterium]
MIIGITGGTGCGKTTALNAIRSLGGLVLDCDAIYHELLKTDENLLNTIGARFPGVVEDGQLQRKKLGAIVFSDPHALQDLNAITHAAIKSEVERRLAAGPELAAIDAIELFSSGLAPLCDTTVAITAPLEDRVRRLMARDGISEEYARNRIAAQHDEAWFRAHCDHVLENNGNFDAFATKCVAFFQNFSIMKGK